MLDPRLFRVACALSLCSALAAAARQEPKTGSAWYEDKVDLGFKVKAPKDWEFVPGSPLEANLIGKYADPGEGKYVTLGHDAEIIAEVLLVKFDKRPKEKKEKRQIGDQTVEVDVKGLADVGLWMERGLDEGKGWHRTEGPSELKCAVAGATYSIYEGMSTRYSGQYVPQPVSAYVASYPLGPQLDVAFVGLGPAGKKWRTFESAYASLAKSLQPVAVGSAGAAKTAPADGKDPRAAKRAELQAKVATMPGWSLYETPNYFIVSCYDDKQFIEELKLRLEAIRAVYEKDYPPSTARKIKPRAAPAGSEPSAGAPPDDPDRTVAPPVTVDALELGKNSVVRVCKDHGQYSQYGGPPQTSGYFSPLEEELVVFDDKQDEGRDATWAVLNHEGFHQYIHAFFGNLSPHSWYNEGTGDYYSGFDFNLKTKKFTPKKEKGRQDNLLLIRDNYAPLKDFVHWTQPEYYGRAGKKGIKGDPLEGWACYAEGWSMIWFLRTGEGKAKGWQKEWGTILDKYLQALLELGDDDKALDKALEKAFEGVDWDAFEEAWRGYMI